MPFRQKPISCFVISRKRTGVKELYADDKGSDLDEIFNQDIPN
jgi:hypothetical protein